ncbi:uncharacterized protein LY89DRAFT_234750 [Mollisia scopiformis]|uniref:Uncharacterized protein n=1 Tax=Mollisia scopiformis TaxID=149040 RepID=A0A194WSS2_MOLSC|nr:uncharacterized protein LY89DRAFT_234750 [Mollisia scopiformis]KUJ11003.1 hypothetical protein LY89DRAFT_234750 [Mollisia scopiformis]
MAYSPTATAVLGSSTAHSTFFSATSSQLIQLRRQHTYITPATKVFGEIENALGQKTELSTPLIWFPKDERKLLGLGVTSPSQPSSPVPEFMNPLQFRRYLQMLYPMRVTMF